MSLTDLNEVEIVQNAALGAALIWRFGITYQEEALNKPPPLPLAFLVLPICLHTETVAMVLSTRKSSGLALFAAKVGEAREDLYGIHIRALGLRGLSLQSLTNGVRAKLLTVAYEAATVRSNQSTAPELPERLKKHWTAAGKLGQWCGVLQLDQVANLLKVEF